MRDCWVLVGFGADPCCPQRPSCRPLALAYRCPWAGFDHENSCFVKYRSEPLTDCTILFLTGWWPSWASSRFWRWAPPPEGGGGGGGGQGTHPEHTHSVHVTTNPAHRPLWSVFPT